MIHGRRGRGSSGGALGPLLFETGESLLRRKSSKRTNKPQKKPYLRLALALSSLIKESGIPVLALARRVGIPKSTLYRLVGGETIPDVFRIYNLCVELNISMDDLMKLAATKKLG